MTTTDLPSGLCSFISVMNDESKCHTPFCVKDCTIDHHDLIKALCIERNRKESSRFSSKSHVLLRQCVQLYEQNGWDRNSSVPDDLPDLRHPLLYLTCAFGKHRVLETLVKLDFDASVVTKDGENGLHALVDHFYRVGNMKQCGGFMAIDKRLEVFENIVSTLCARDPKIFSEKEQRNGRTPLHNAAESVVCTSRHARVDGRCDPLKRTRYFQRCLEVMLGHLLELKQNSLIPHARLMETIAAQDNDGNTILHILAKSSSLPGWEAIQFVLKNFGDSEFPFVKNKQLNTAFEMLSSMNTTVARKLFYPSDSSINVEEKVYRDANVSSTPNCELPPNPEVSASAAITSTPYFTSSGNHEPDITVKAVWSQADQVKGAPPRGIQHGSSLKSLESVVLSLHTTAKEHPNTGIPGSSNHNSRSSSDVCDGHSHDSVSLEMLPECSGDNCAGCMDCGSHSLSSNGVAAQTGSSEDFASPGLSSDEPYPVFLPTFPASRSETDGTNSSPHEITKHKVNLTFSPCHVSPLHVSQNNLEVENHVGASPLTSESWTQRHEIVEPTATSTPVASNGLSHLESMVRNTAGNDHHVAHSDNPEGDTTVQQNSKSSSSGDSAFFDFLLTQGSEFNPSMKYQIVELIKTEFGKKMAIFNTEICQTETERRHLEAEIRNSKLKLQQKEEEKLRLFTEIDNLQKSIIQATERHKLLAEQSMKLKEESKAVKRKISSCEDVERELCGSPAKINKLVER